MSAFHGHRMEKCSLTPFSGSFRHGFYMLTDALVLIYSLLPQKSLLLRRPSVECISAQGMSDPRHMHTDLMRSSGFDLKSHKRFPISFRKNPVMCHRAHSCCTDSHFHKNSGRLLHIQVNGAAWFFLGKRSLADPQIGTNENTLLALTLQSCCRRPASCKNKNS